MTDDQKSEIWDWIQKAIPAAVLALAGWGISAEVRLATDNVTEAEGVRIQSDLKEFAVEQDREKRAEMMGLLERFADRLHALETSDK